MANSQIYTPKDKQLLEYSQTVSACTAMEQWASQAVFNSFTSSLAEKSTWLGSSRTSLGPSFVMEAFGLHLPIMLLVPTHLLRPIAERWVNNFRQLIRPKLFLSSAHLPQDNSFQTTVTSLQKFCARKIRTSHNIFTC